MTGVSAGVETAAVSARRTLLHLVPTAAQDQLGRPGKVRQSGSDGVLSYRKIGNQIAKM